MYLFVRSLVPGEYYLKKKMICISIHKIKQNTKKNDDSALFGGIYNPFFGWAKFL